MSSMWGKNIKISVFGESHGKAIGVTVDGLPAGFEPDMDKVAKYMARRRPGGDLSTPRKESDMPDIVSGMFRGKLTGAPLTALIYNCDTKSGDYDQMSAKARPGHADYTAYVKYNGANDYRGGGHFSGRLTACLVFAGAICAQILEEQGITIAAHISEIGGVKDEPFGLTVSGGLVKKLTEGFPVIDDAAGEKMRARIAEAAADKDSVGGSVECVVSGVPAGVGSPMFDGVENKIASLVFGIPAVKGVEFGLGFGYAAARGGQVNDAFRMDGDEVVTATNNCGGVLGGITDGMPIVFRAAFKPTPSIARKQRTVDFVNGADAEIEIKGRHDPCVVVRAVPVVEAAAAIAVLDLLYEN